ncbi:MAG TPA: type II secretion system F family protein [Anaerolineales bacterium]|nr:type II secretion system F family protein [Anaerolineales bacterium]
MSTTLLLVLGVSLSASGLVLVVLGLRGAAAWRFTRRLSNFVDEGSYSTPGTVLDIRQLEGSIVKRVIDPGIQALGNFISRFTPKETISALNKQLAIANNPMGMTAREFYAVRIIMLLGFSLLAVYYFSIGGYTIFAVLFPLVGYFIPLVWIRARVRIRKSSLLRALPDVLDLFSVCSSAGLGFDQTIQRVSEYYDNPLGEELRRIIMEMEIGISRQDAFRNLAQRLEIPELSSFVSILLQAEQMGMSIADTLAAQAEQMRVLRRYTAQEAAQRMPVKMVFPLVFLILPALLLVILGPAIPALANLFGR